MVGAAFLRDVLQASRILKVRGGGCGLLTTCLNIRLGFLELGPLLRSEIRIFKGVFEARRIGAGQVRRRKILAVRLTERKAAIKSRAARFLWARLAIITSRFALLRHLETARQTLLHLSRAGDWLRCLRHCDLDACFLGTRRKRGGEKYGANKCSINKYGAMRCMSEQVQPCFHDSPSTYDADVGATNECWTVNQAGPVSNGAQREGLC